MAAGLRINVGCGQTPTQGWRNFDNSPSVLLARMAFVPDILRRIRMISAPSYDFICFARRNHIEFANAAKSLPLHDNCAAVLYSSHMLEHLDREEAINFLTEGRRVLRPGGIIRLAVPDIRMRVERYLASGDADAFIASTLMAISRPRSLVERAQLFLLGNRMHNWMYDGPSLAKLLTACGYVDPVILSPGETTIPHPEPLDLCERWDESVYVEAKKPE